MGNNPAKYNPIRALAAMYVLAVVQRSLCRGVDATQS